MTGKAIDDAISPEIAWKERLKVRIENRRGPVDPGTQNESHQTGDAERNYRADQIVAAPRPLFIVLRPKSVGASCENPGTQEGIEKQRLAEIICNCTVGYATEKNSQQVAIPGREPGISGHGDLEAN